MKAKRRSGLVTDLLFVLAALLLLGSTAGSSRAEMEYISAYYRASVQMKDIGVTLMENGERVAYRDYNGTGAVFGWSEESKASGELLTKMLEETEGELVPGHRYREELKVRNTGTIDQYVRVSIYRYWATYSGGREIGRRTDLDPDLIRLDVLTGNGWVEDEEARTRERTVLYYQPILSCAGENSEKKGDTDTALFADALTVADEGVLTQLTKGTTSKTDTVTYPDGSTHTVTTYTTTYTYDGARFVLRVDVDAVQTHNAADAIRSAWGLTAERSAELGIEGIQAG